MKILALGTLLFLGFSMAAASMEYPANSVIFNGAFGAGTFSAGEHDDGSVFWGGSLSADWIPSGKTGISYGIESGLGGGKTGDTAVFGIPVIFRLGWHPKFIRSECIDIFLLGKIGWAFGVWGPQLDEDAVPNGIVCGINIGGRYVFTPVIGAYAEIGYTYYGLARNSKHPDYPLGYGSGKIYGSAGISIFIRHRK
ncbi:hypothetical protein [Breznakiella homolactica]|uniref:Outer membrane protein beta-barrel domain-containing protein n=1 Tax=Breznakiella homolactica TaxID=2798577 RepID=A0A7T7XP95_9SPIR|nr:hypothetical protein [Breznakiella homolactica]QQO09976.1 hypothetical protein JFL75_03420 [Breznakiella homolactica]